MAISHYLVHGKSFTRRDTLPDVPEGSPDVSWTHAVAPTPEELTALLDDLGACADVREAIHSATPHPDFFISEGVGFLCLPVQIPGTWRRTYLTFVLRGHHLLSLCPRPIDYVESFCRRVEAAGAEDADVPFAELLAACARADRTALQAMRHAVDRLDTLVDEDADGITIGEVRELRDAVVSCGDICEDQANCLASMTTLAGDVMLGKAAAAARGPMRTLIDHAARSFDRLAVRTRELESQLRMSYQKKTEDRLRVLTVISAIFSPLTVIAGIYGMNFERIPELSVPHAYFLALGGMAALALTLLAGFYHRGWLAPSR